VDGDGEEGEEEDREAQKGEKREGETRGEREMMCCKYKQYHTTLGIARANCNLI
jgi:hypothetical protein